MLVDRKGFQGLVADVATNKNAVIDMCANFEPFFGIVEHGAYVLRVSKQGMYRDATAAVQLLLADDTARICPFSVSRPYAAPSWMTKETYIESIRNNLKREMLGSEFLMRIVAGTTDETVRQRVADVIKLLDSAQPWEDFTQGLNDAVTATFRARVIDGGVVSNIQTGVQDFLRAYLAVALTDARPWLVRLAPVIAVLSACIPYSRRSSTTCKDVITLFA